MPLSLQEQQELAELEELDRLEKEVGHKVPKDNLFESVMNPQALPPGELLRQEQANLNMMKQAQSPEDLPPHLRMGFEAGQGSIGLAAGEPLAAAARGIGGGIRKVGDIIMQKAVGLKKYAPGVGETLAKEGVMGTKGAMQNQVEQALNRTGQRMGSLAESVPEVSTKPIAEQLGERASKLIGPDGRILPENIAEFNKLASAAGEASAEGSISGQTAAFRRMQQGKIARNAGRYRENPAQGLKAQIAGEQQAAYSNALKNAAGPDLAEASQTYGNLSKASEALEAPESLSTSGILSQFVPTSLAESALGRSLMGLGKGVQSTQGAARVTPATLEELLGKKK